MGEGGGSEVRSVWATARISYFDGASLASRAPVQGAVVGPPFPYGLHNARGVSGTCAHCVSLGRTCWGRPLEDGKCRWTGMELALTSPPGMWSPAKDCAGRSPHDMVHEHELRMGTSRVYARAHGATAQKLSPQAGSTGRLGGRRTLSAVGLAPVQLGTPRGPFRGWAESVRSRISCRRRPDAPAQGPCPAHLR